MCKDNTDENDNKENVDPFGEPGVGRQPNVRRRDSTQQRPQSHQEATTRRHRPLLLQPKHFGLQTWNPDLCDIYEHLDRVQACIPEARTMGATEANLIRLLKGTLPDEYQYLDQLVSKSSLSKYEDYAKEVAAALGTRQEQKMAEFFAASKRSGENVLAFFARLLALYQSSNSFEDDSWKSKHSHGTALYAKVNASLNPEARNELRRMVQPDMIQKTLSVTALKKFIINIHRLRLDGRHSYADNRHIMMIKSEGEDEDEVSEFETPKDQNNQ